MSDNGKGGCLMAIVLVIVVGLLLVIGPKGCTDSDGTVRVLQDQGYTNIEITGWRPFSGGNDDQFHTGFRATTAAGKVVTGVVTSGCLKGKTIRLD